MIEHNAKLSIIVPVYNTVPYLEDCISSLLRQTYDDFEIILVDDGSTDNSFEICEEYAKKYPVIQAYSRPHLGPNAARLFGIKKSKGQYIGFVDSDDWIEADIYNKLIKEMEKDNEIDISVASILKEYASKSISMYGTSERKVMDRAEAIYEMLANRIYRWMLWGKCYRRSLFKNININESIFMCEDLLLNCHLFLKTRKALYIPDLGYHYRMREGSAVFSRFDPKLNMAEAFFEIMPIFKDFPHKSQEYFTWLLLNTTFTNIIYMAMNSEKSHQAIMTRYVEALAYWKESLVISKVLTRREAYVLDLIFKKSAAESVSFIEKIRKNIMMKIQSFCSKHSAIYIYGAGTLGNLLGEMLEELGICYAGYVVTSKAENFKTSAEHNVYEWSEIKNSNEDIGVLIALRPNHKRQMNNMLKEKPKNVNIYWPLPIRYANLY